MYFHKSQIAKTNTTQCIVEICSLWVAAIWSNCIRDNLLFHSMVGSCRDRIQTDGTHELRLTNRWRSRLSFEHRSTFYHYDALGLLAGVGATLEKSSFKGLRSCLLCCTTTGFSATKKRSSSPLFRALMFFIHGIWTMYSWPDIFSFVTEGTMKRTSSCSMAMFAFCLS